MSFPLPTAVSGVSGGANTTHPPTNTYPPLTAPLLLNIALEDLVADPNQVREYADNETTLSFERLVASIEAKGIEQSLLVEPIISHLFRLN